MLEERRRSHCLVASSQAAAVLSRASLSEWSSESGSKRCARHFSSRRAQATRVGAHPRAGQTRAQSAQDPLVLHSAPRPARSERCPPVDRSRRRPARLRVGTRPSSLASSSAAQSCSAADELVQRPEGLQTRRACERCPLRSLDCCRPHPLSQPPRRPAHHDPPVGAVRRSVPRDPVARTRQPRLHDLPLCRARRRRPLRRSPPQPAPQDGRRRAPDHPRRQLDAARTGGRAAARRRRALPSLAPAIVSRSPLSLARRSATSSLSTSARPPTCTPSLVPATKRPAKPASISRPRA